MLPLNVEPVTVRRAALVIDGAAEAVDRRIVDEGRVGDGRHAAVVVDGPAVIGGDIIREGGAGDRERPRIVDAGPGAGPGSIIGEQRVGDREGPRIVDGAARGRADTVGDRQAREGRRHTAGDREDPEGAVAADRHDAEPGPSMVIGAAVSVKASVPSVRVMVWGTLNAPLVSKTMVIGLVPVLTLAKLMADRNVPGMVESAAVVTRYEELASKAPMSMDIDRRDIAHAAKRPALVDRRSAGKAELPAFMAGLVGVSGIVWVGPPLFDKRAEPGARDIDLVAVGRGQPAGTARAEQVVRAGCGQRTRHVIGGPVLSVFLATIVLYNMLVPADASRPPPVAAPPETLSAIVCSPTSASRSRRCHRPRRPCYPPGCHS